MTNKYSVQSQQETANYLLFISNDFQQLLNKLLVTLEQQSTDIFNPPIVIVQSIQMAHLIKLEFAKKHKIVLGLKVLYPEAFVSFLEEKLLKDLQKESHANSLTWIIFSIIEKILKDKQSQRSKENQEFIYKELIEYLENDSLKDNQIIKRFSLASKIENIFNRYILYRKEMLLKWEENELLLEHSNMEVWQSHLWRLIKEEFPKEKNLINRIEDLSKNFKRMKQSILIFGLSYLPTIYFDFFKVLSKVTKVIYFQLDCVNFFSKNKSSLLKFIDEQGKEFIEKLVSNTNKQNISQVKVKQAKENNTFLSMIKTDLLYSSEEVSQEEINVEKIIKNEKKQGTFQIHNCHNKLREIEVLKDNLLHLLKYEETFNTNDILVMAPEINDYAYLIESIFNKDNLLKDNYSIIDKFEWKENTIIQDFLNILDFLGSRFEISKLITIISSKNIYLEFSFTNQSINQLIELLLKANIKWGQSLKDRKDIGRFSENSWERGIKRLLLAYAMHPKEGLLVEEDIYFDFTIDEEESVLLGNFLKFFENIKRINQDILKEHSFEEWIVISKEIIDTFFQENKENELEKSQLMEQILTLEEQIKLVNEKELEKITKESFAFILNLQITSQIRKYGYLTGKINFCSLMPMRNIPFKVIYLLGMEQSNFPRSDNYLNFDVAGNEFKQGERYQRKDDNFLFLETLLACQSYFYVSLYRAKWKEQTK